MDSCQHSTHTCILIELQNEEGLSVKYMKARYMTFQEDRDGMEYGIQICYMYMYLLCIRCQYLEHYSPRPQEFLPSCPVND